MHLDPFAVLMALFSSGCEVLGAYIVTRFKHSVVRLRCWMSVFKRLVCSHMGKEEKKKNRRNV